MSKLREAAQAALEHWDKVSGIFRMTTETEALRAALAEPKTELRDQHKAFTHWYFGLRGINEANFSPEDLAWAAWKAALAQPETAEPVAWAVVCDGNAVSTCLTETAANLIAENLREKNRGRDFDWQTTPLYAHPPRDVQPPTEGSK